MNFKKNIKKLMEFKSEMLKYAYIEKNNIKPIINWKNKLQKKVKTTSTITNLNECKSWYFDKNMNLYHQSGQFFKIKGVKTEGATGREVESWTQPILTQKHGGVLAFIARQTKKFGTEFLLDAKIEPGDDSLIKISPSFQDYSGAAIEPLARQFAVASIFYIEL